MANVLQLDCSTTIQAVLALIVSSLSWILVKGIYNVTLHPLAKYPGPKLAGFTGLWKMHVELIDKTNLADRLFELHGKYGEIVRVAPNELHFSRPAAYHEIYNARNRWTKDPMLYHAFAESESSFTIVDYARAKKRKDILLPLFSRKAIVDMQHLIQECVDEMCWSMNVQDSGGERIDILRGYRCFAVDAITSFCFAKSMGALAEPGFDAPIERAMTLSLPMITWIKYFPVIKTFITWCPPVLVRILKSNLAGLMRMRKMLWDQVLEVTKHPETLEKVEHPIIYHELLNPVHGQKPPSFTSLRDEALLLVFAGTDTVSNTLTLGTVHILSNPAVQAKLTLELREAWPQLDTKPRYEFLEGLPYLRACIKESLRLALGTLTPMTRIVPSTGAEISGRYVPGGTKVAISHPFVLLNDTIFPEPYSFKPERWLVPASETENLDNWLISFSKGPRSCLGINLAYCELTVALANLFRRFEMKLDGMSAANLRWQECYLPHYIGPDIRVKATPRAE